MASQRKVLVAEDSPGLARVVQFNLQHAGYDVTLARNGREAWDAVSAAEGENRFDIVLSDQQMPEMTGTDLRTRMCTDSGLRQIPFILLTAKGLEMDQAQLRSELDVTAIVAKPFSPAELVQVIEATLGAPA